MPHEQRNPPDDEPDRGTKGTTNPLNEEVPQEHRREEERKSASTEGEGSGVSD